MAFYPLSIFFVLLSKTGLLILIFLSISSPSNAQNSIKTGITGIVADDKGPLPGATVHVLETKQIITSTNNGAYTLYIKPGEYTIQFSFIGLKTTSRRVTIGPMQMLKLEMVLTTDAKMLGVVNVSATRKAGTQRALLQLRKESSNIQDGIGAVQIDKSASITTAQALQRVTGVTVYFEESVLLISGQSGRQTVYREW